jgi:hypothetical protein
MIDSENIFYDYSFSVVFVKNSAHRAATGKILGFVIF